MILPKTEDGLKSRRSSKYWRKRRWSERKFVKEFGEFEFAVVTDSAQVAYWLPKIHALFLRRWEHEHTGSEWVTEEGFQPFAEAMLTLAPKGRASLAVLYRADGELLGYGYCLDQNRTRYFFQHASSPEPAYRAFGLGPSLITRLLRDTTASDDFDHFDFMIGVQSYKLEWANCIQRTWQVILEEDYENKWHFRQAVLRARCENSVRKNALANRFVKKMLAMHQPH